MTARSHHPPDPPADRRPHPRAARGHPLPGAGAGGAGPQGHLRARCSPTWPPRASPGPASTARSTSSPTRSTWPATSSTPSRWSSTASCCARASSAASPTRWRRRCSWPRAWPRSRSCRRKDGDRPTTEPRAAHLQPAPRLPDLTARPSRSWPPATSRSTRPTAPASTATASAPASRSTPSSSCPTPTCRSPRAPSPRGRGGHSQYFKRLLEAVAEELGIDVDAPWAKLTEEAAEGVPLRHRRGQGAGPLQEPLRPHPRATHAKLRGRHPVPAAPPQRGRERHASASRSRATCARCRAPTCGGARLKPLPLAVTIDGHTIAEICDMSIGEAAKVARRPRRSPSATA